MSDRTSTGKMYFISGMIANGTPIEQYHLPYDQRLRVGFFANHSNNGHDSDGDDEGNGVDHAARPGRSAL